MAIKVNLLPQTKQILGRRTRIIFREVPEYLRHSDSPNGIQQINKQASTISNDLQSVVSKEIGKFYQDQKKNGLLTDKMTDALLDLRDNLVDEMASREYERTFRRLKSVCRKKGKPNAKTPKFSKPDFFQKLNSFIKDYYKVHDELPKQKFAAKYLSLPNEKALQRKMRVFDEERHFTNYCSDILKL